MLLHNSPLKTRLSLTASFAFLSQIKYGPSLTNCVFKSCWKDRIYEVNTHERLHEAIITTGTLWIFFKPRVSDFGGVSVRKHIRHSHK